MSDISEVVESYISYVSDTVSRFSKIGDLINGDEVSPSKLNKALAEFYNVSLALNSEYQRQKINHSVLETDYQIWYDDKFLEAKSIVMEGYANSRSIKPSIKEFEIELRRSFRSEWKEWDLKLKESEAKTQFLLRLRETLYKYDNILTSLSNNMRGEMRALSIENRANHDNVKTRRVRV